MDPLNENELFPGVDRLKRLCAPAGDSAPPPRTLLALAHPDDETTGASSRLTRADVVACVYATDGDPRDQNADSPGNTGSVGDQARLRRAETLRALAHAGISSERAVFLGYPDQRVAYRLLPLVADLRRWLIATRPEVVLTHAYEGGHPDHDAVAFAVHAAASAVAQDDEPLAPTIIEFASYHAAGGEVAFGTFLQSDDAMEHTVQLTADGRALKRRLLACHRSQAQKWAGLHLDEERFRLAPVYDFCRPPHEGAVLYEHRKLMTAEAWCALASTATEQLAQTSQTCVLK